jgi:hypothetical protein
VLGYCLGVGWATSAACAVSTQQAAYGGHVKPWGHHTHAKPCERIGKRNGAADGTRTHDIQIGKRVDANPASSDGGLA